VNHSAWWRGLPLWLRSVYLFVALPAWLFIMFCVVTGQDKSLAALGAFGVFALTVLLNIVFDRRRGGTDHEVGGIEFDGADS
jgi:hypothetical protein